MTLLSAFKGKKLHSVSPFVRFRSNRDQFQILYILPDGATQLWSKKETGEFAPLRLPTLSQDAKPHVLSKHDPTKLSRTLQELVVRGRVTIILLGSQNVDCLNAKLLRNRPWHVDIHVQCDGHGGNP